MFIKEPEHGLILADTSSTRLLSLPIADYYLSKSPQDFRIPPRYSDSLRLLAKYGFGVVIPEMVGFQVSETLKGGESPGTHFTDTSRSDYFAQGRAFLNQVREDKNPRCWIESPDQNDRSVASEYLRLMRMYLQETGKQSHFHDRVKRIKALRETKTKGYANMTVMDMIERIPENWSKPIFYLSDDEGMWKYLHKARPKLNIVIINTKSFLTALHENGLFPALSMDVDAEKAQQMTALMNQEHFQRFGHKLDILPYGLDRALDQDGEPVKDLFRKALLQVKDKIIQDFQSKEIDLPVTPEQEARALANQREIAARRMERASSWSSKTNPGLPKTLKQSREGFKPSSADEKTSPDAPSDNSQTAAKLWGMNLSGNPKQNRQK